MKGKNMNPARVRVRQEVKELTPEEIRRLEEIIMAEKKQYLNLLLIMTYQLGILDSLKDSQYYKHGLKAALTNAKKELERLGHDLGLVYGENDEVMFEIMNSLERIMQAMAGISPEDVQVLDVVIQRLKTDKEAVYAMFNCVPVPEKEVSHG